MKAMTSVMEPAVHLTADGHCRFSSSCASYQKYANGITASDITPLRGCLGCADKRGQGEEAAGAGQRRITGADAAAPPRTARPARTWR